MTWRFLQRCALGVVLITALATLLLLSDLRSRTVRSHTAPPEATLLALWRTGADYQSQLSPLAEAA